MKFVKVQAAGNDFILVERGRLYVGWSNLARKWCDRHYGIGADGLIVLEDDSKSSIGMRIFNPDGSEAESCGNGLRCTAKYAFENEIVDSDSFTIRTLAGDTWVKVLGSGRKKGNIESVTVTMTEPVFDPKSIPVNIPSTVKLPVLDYHLPIDGPDLQVSIISMGNPHAIAFITGSIESFPLESIGPTIEHLTMFPKRTNFEVVKVVDRRTIKARVWERGAGETLACGTGACAIGVAARLKGLVDSPVEIVLPGGNLKIEWSEGERVRMTGPVTEVYKGEIDLNETVKPY
jgi:diaminopimelate epimerase